MPVQGLLSQLFLPQVKVDLYFKDWYLQKQILHLRIKKQQLILTMKQINKYQYKLLD